MSSSSSQPHRIAEANVARPPAPVGPTWTAWGARIAKRRPNDTHLRDILLVALAFAWGSIDAISFGGLGKVYSTAQTGNLITLGLGAGGASGAPVLRAGVSVAAFAIGVVIATRIVGHPPAGALWPRRLEAVLVVIAGILISFLVFWIVVNGHPSSTSADLLIAISALGGGMETGAIFRLGLRAVFTTALTATWTTFASDVDDDVTRDRDDAVDQVRLLLIVVGAFAGVAAGAALLFNGFRDIAPILAPALTLAVAATARVAFGPSRSVTGRSPRRGTAPASQPRSGPTAKSGYPAAGRAD